MPITRTPIIDDDGTGQTGTIINNAWKQEFYNQIDDALAVVSWPGGVAGQIAFPATQNPSSGANVLDDYEEGAFTPTDASGAGLALTNASGLYVKIGRLVVAHYCATYPATSNGNGAQIFLTGLPISDAGVPEFYGTTLTAAGYVICGVLTTGQSWVHFVRQTDATAVTNADLSTRYIGGTMMYRTTG